MFNSGEVNGVQVDIKKNRTIAGLLKVNNTVRISFISFSINWYYKETNFTSVDRLY